MKRLAVRTLRLCTKDCLCLYVCPTGATDTENSIIDTAKCIGCGVCADACPSGAISMVPIQYPPQQKKSAAVVTQANALAASKAAQETLARQLAQETEAPGLYRLLLAAEKSARLVNEDLLREAGYMLPQSANTHQLLQSWIDSPPAPTFPLAAAKALLEQIPCNEEQAKGETRHMSKWKCKVCGYIYEGKSLPEDFTCPVCKQPASSFTKLEDVSTPGSNKYAGTQTEKNLQEAFAGESQARNKYTYFATVAKNEGYEQIAALFLKTAKNEKAHAKMWFDELNGLGNNKTICCMRPKGKTMSGRICTTVSPKRLKKKDFPNWPLNSAWLPPLKSTMKSVIGRCCTIWKPLKSLTKVKSKYGNAATADIS